MTLKPLEKIGISKKTVFDDLAVTGQEVALGGPQQGIRDAPRDRCSRRQDDGSRVQGSQSVSKVFLAALF